MSGAINNRTNFSETAGERKGTGSGVSTVPLYYILYGGHGLGLCSDTAIELCGGEKRKFAKKISSYVLFWPNRLNKEHLFFHNMLHISVRMTDL